MATATKKKAAKKVNFNVGTCAGKYRQAQARFETARADLDDCVRRGHDAGLSYREIADQIGMSLGWVQASMARSDPGSG